MALRHMQQRPWRRVELDHQTPLHDGGADEEHNLRPLCPGCHASKTQAERVAAMHRRRAAVTAAKLEASEATRTRSRPPTLEEQTAAFCANRFLAYAYDGGSRPRR